MEFSEKLQELRKNKDLTQEELAESIYVSRAAVSKWESGRGYPSIDSLKELSKFFSVSVDDLLSGEKLIFIAEKENKANIKKIINTILGIIDLLAVLLIVLPLYPNEIDGFVFSVPLFDYTQISEVNLCAYWFIVVSMIIAGIVKVVVSKFKSEKKNEFLTGLSLIINALAVLFFSFTREPYAASIAFLIFIIKGILFLKYLKSIK